MEESGSEGLDQMLMSRQDTKFMQEVDYCCISDNYWLGKNKPCLTYGLRGVCYFFIEVRSCFFTNLLKPFVSRSSVQPWISTVESLEEQSMKAWQISSG